MRLFCIFSKYGVVETPACSPSSHKSRPSWSWLFISLFLVIPSPVCCEIGTDLLYGGQVHDSATVDSIRRQVEPLIPEAVTGAEDLLGLALDRDRLLVQLQDLVIKGGGRTLKMRTFGNDTLTIYVFIEPILRGYLRDSDDIAASLTHEMMHVIVRQHISPEAYRRLPIWFREGVPHFLLAQGETRLLNGLGKYYKNPSALLGGLGRGTHFAEPEIAGYFFLAQLNDQIGREGLQRFIHGVLDSQSITGGLGGFSPQELGVPTGDSRPFEDLPENDQTACLDSLWDNAASRARDVLAQYVHEVAQPLFECMTVYFQGRSRNPIATDCFQELIADYPASYAAQISHYWLGLCFYRAADLETSRSYLAKFVEFERDYGLLDDARYYELMIQVRSNGDPAELILAAENFLKLFPEAKKAPDVKKMVKSLTEKLADVERAE